MSEELPSNVKAIESNIKPKAKKKAKPQKSAVGSYTEEKEKLDRSLVDTRHRIGEVVTWEDKHGEIHELNPMSSSMHGVYLQLASLGVGDPTMELSVAIIIYMTVKPIAHIRKMSYRTTKTAAVYNPITHEEITPAQVTSCPLMDEILDFLDTELDDPETVDRAMVAATEILNRIHASKTRLDKEDDEEDSPKH